MMKLKRCPNLHYYDGDKYDRCPHCSEASAPPAPEPKPVIEPAPQPVPEVRPIPEPIKQSVPEFSSAAPVQQKPQNEEQASKPVQEIKAEPSSPSSDNITWRCKCGAVNRGRFCADCGLPKPAPEIKKEPAASSSKWKCSCGAENSGKFCFQCGQKKPETNDVQITFSKPAPTNEALRHDEPPKPVEAVKPAVQPKPAEPPKQKHESESNLTSQINASRFTGTMEDAQKKSSARDDEGVTQVVFDEIDDGYVLAWLTVTNTSSKGKVFSLTSPKATIGRSDTEHPVDIDLRSDKGISRGAQAVFVYDPLNKKFFLQSSGGKTYVYVNREMLLTYKELNPYDIVKIGETDLVFVPLCSDKFSW